jgi:hypothetical protein
MTTIIQVLGRLNYYEVNYRIESIKKSIKSKLSSVAIYKNLKKEKVNLIYYIPESLVAQLIDDPLDAIECLKTPENLIKKYRILLNESIGEEIDFQLRIIQSIGYYNNRKSKYILHFKNHIENVIIQFLTDLLDIQGDLIVDISTGFNIYTQALNEAIRNLIVYKKLKIILQNSNDFKVNYAITPPVLGPKPEWIYPLVFNRIDATAFFEFPYDDLNINTNLISISDFPVRNKKEKIDICKKFPKLDNKSRYLIELSLLTYNAIKYNVPLPLFTKNLLNLFYFHNLLNF